MKLNNLLIGAATAMMIASCNKEDLKIYFTMPASEMEFTVQPTNAVGEMIFAARNVTFNLDSVCLANSVNKDQIKSVKVKSVFFDIDPLTPANFDKVDWVEGYLSADALPTTLLASKNPVSHDGSKSIALTIQDIELIEYINKPTMSFQAKGKNNAPILAAIPMKARIQFDITALLVN
ncbi:MAG: hypothetical protein EXR21_07395 [Flavobacteriaceae bacterium]|nr:hypothetical protein [Flavobacteriaceae bacterium]